jgi:hypothetical protein
VKKVRLNGGVKDVISYVHLGNLVSTAVVNVEAYQV